MLGGGIGRVAVLLAARSKGEGMQREAVVEVFDIEGKIAVVALSWWRKMGVWAASRSMTALAAESTDDELGIAVLALLGESTSVVPDTSQTATDLLLDVFALRSRSQLMKRARYVLVKRDVGRSSISVFPSIPSPHGSGFVTVPPDQALLLDDPSGVDLGRTVRQAIQLTADAMRR